MPIPLARNARLAALLLLTSLAGAGCSDQTGPAGTDAEAGGDLADARIVHRAPRIDYVSVDNNTVYVNGGESYLTAVVTLTNGQGKATGLSLQALVVQGATTKPMTTPAIHCANDDGTLPHGVCTLTLELSGTDLSLVTGSADFNLRLLQNGTFISGWQTTVNVLRF